MTRREPCACGGMVVVKGNSDEAIFEGVRRHNQGERHRWFRALGGLEMVARPASLAVSE